MNAAAIAWINLIATIIESAPLIIAALDSHPAGDADEAVTAAAHRLETASANWKAAIAAYTQPTPDAPPRPATA